MLEKNKDYVEFTLQCTSVEYGKTKDYKTVSFNGYSDPVFPSVPMDVVCNEFGHKVVMMSKSDFDKLQANDDINAELAKQWEINYDLLLKKTGFDTVESLVFYLNQVGQDTLLNTLASYISERDKALEECEVMKKKLEECEKDYISERDKAEALEAENEQLKKKLHEFDPIPDYKELLEKLYSKDDVEKLEWTLNHICGGQASVNGWMVTAKIWRRNYETLSKLVGFSSVEEIQDYLTNEAECDTLHEAILKLIDEKKYSCEQWCDANSRNNSWKAAAECNSPKELIEKIEGLEGKVKVLETEAEVYSRALQDWKEITGYPSPSAVKTALESGASWRHAYNEIKKANEKLADDVNSWKNVTGYSTPEDYMQARISGAFHTPFDYTASWQKATGCSTPEQAKERIKALNERIDESEACYNHLLCTTGFESEGEIEDALDRCDHSTLRKALVDYEFDYEALLKLTGYKSEQDIRVALNYSEQFVYETLRELINSLKRQAKYTNLNWQNSTDFITPEKCGEYIKKLEDKLHRINGILEEA